MRPSKAFLSLTSTSFCHLWKAYISSFWREAKRIRAWIDRSLNRLLYCRTKITSCTGWKSGVSLQLPLWRRRSNRFCLLKLTLGVLHLSLQDLLLCFISRNESDTDSPYLKGNVWVMCNWSSETGSFTCTWCRAGNENIWCIENLKEAGFSKCYSGRRDTKKGKKPEKERDVSRGKSRKVPLMNHSRHVSISTALHTFPNIIILLLHLPILHLPMQSCLPREYEICITFFRVFFLPKSTTHTAIGSSPRKRGAF